MTEKISLACDPGVNGALIAIDDDRRILFSVKFKDGVPPDDFTMRYISGKPYSHRFTLLTVRGKFPIFNSAAEILVTLETHNWRHASMKRSNIKPNLAAKHEFYAGRIYQWLAERGFGGLIKEVEPREWQAIVKGAPGAGPKERVEWWAFNEYCLRPEGNFKSIVLCDDCDCSKEDCPLKKHGIRGPKGGYDKDLGDSLATANWRLNMERAKG